MADERQIPVTRELMMAWGFRAIIAGTVVIGGPTVWGMLSRVLTTADEISATLHSHDTKLEVINDRISGVRETLQDHENRLRAIEHPAERGPR